MSVLIDMGMPEWMTDEAMRDQLAPYMPGVTFHCGAPQGILEDVTMLTVTSRVRDSWDKLPNLQVIQKLGAGVDAILAHKNLPAHIRIARLAPDIQAREIAEYCLTTVLVHQRHILNYVENMRIGSWDPMGPRETEKTTVAVLGLGHIGMRVAKLVRDVGFRTLGWARRPREEQGIACFHGADGLIAVLAEADYVIGILPATDLTRDMFNKELFGQFKQGAVFINVGRGTQVVEEELMASLDAGHLGGAVLDVVRTEPLPSDSPLWEHPKILVTPHVSGWNLAEAYADVAENYRRVVAGEPLLHQVDRDAGY